MMERRKAVRLRVVYRRVHCPFGRNQYDDTFREKELVENGGWRERGDTLDPRYRISGSALTCEGKNQAAEEIFGPFTFLHNCYLDSSMPEHPCFGCKQAKTWRKTLGLRTFRIVLELTDVNTLGQPHQDFPMQIVYLPLNRQGTEWYAMNALTGERKEIVRSVEEHRRTDGKLLTVIYPRRTPSGQDLEQQFQISGSSPVWNLKPRDEWRCTCATCTGQEQRMNDDDDNDPIRALNVNARGIRKSVHDYPSAPNKPTADQKPAPRQTVEPAAPRLAIAEMFNKPENLPHMTVPTPDSSLMRLLNDNRKEKRKRRAGGDDYVSSEQILSEGFRTLTDDKPKILALKSSVKKSSTPVKTKGRRKK